MILSTLLACVQREREREREFHTSLSLKIEKTEIN